jgi:hypothetical protein
VDLAGAVVTADAVHAQRDTAAYIAGPEEDGGRDSDYFLSVLGNQPNLSAQLSAPPWETTPVTAATSETARGRIETRTVRVLPAPAGTGFEGAAQAVLIERYTTHKRASGAPAARPSPTSPASAQKTRPRKTRSPTYAATGGSSTPTGYAT